MRRRPAQLRGAKYAVIFLAAVALAGCDMAGDQTLPDSLTPLEVEQFRTAVTAEGCAITTGALARSVKIATGFDDDKLRLITQYLTLAGESQRLDRGFRLTSGSCANA